jgi:Uma2 family endonuclease
MGRAEPKPLITAEEYLERERKAEFKSEYYRGEVFAMAGGTHDHSIIAGNLLENLKPALRAKGCTATGSDLRVSTSEDGLYTYPDVLIYCGKPVFKDDTKDTLLNPTSIIEVLSPSTRNYDRGTKFQLYREITTLREYVLVDTERRFIERWFMTDTWILDKASGSASIEIAGCMVSVDQVYADTEVR